ncbi:hypothetical protein [Undibacterium squillarum]|uniref:Uncharacterized protein n=1 Tax=Undibacterium squillarum TaxID=1131567 RepID=A0ABQ2XS72_9BURK|nr:hypothetical protein [Undibacterium squillarum]GGX31126.1 hypothetical protein GCM10010946_05260 [Undibacterium squillarum]
MAVTTKRDTTTVRAVSRQKTATVKDEVKKAEVAKVAAKAPVRLKVAKAPAKPAKTRLVRDSFTMPEDEYAILGATKKACLKAGIEVKKSQLLRIGLLLLSQTETPALKKLIAELPVLKAGRPKKDRD